MTTDQDDWYGPDTATFGDRLAAARESAGLTQEQLAKRLGVRVPTLRRWEQDVAEPRANRLSMLAGLLNVSMSWLIMGEGEGVAAPDDTSGLTDLNGVLLEIRSVRMQMHASLEKMARLEKQLRIVMTEPGLIDPRPELAVPDLPTTDAAYAEPTPASDFDATQVPPPPVPGDEAEAKDTVTIFPTGGLNEEDT